MRSQVLQESRRSNFNLLSQRQSYQQSVGGSGGGRWVSSVSRVGRWQPPRNRALLRDKWFKINTRSAPVAQLDRASAF